MDSNGTSASASNNDDENDGQDKYIDVTASSDSPSQRGSPGKQPIRAESDTESESPAAVTGGNSIQHPPEQSRGPGRPRRDLLDTSVTSSKPVGTSDSVFSGVANAPICGGLQVLGQAVESATLASLRDPPREGVAAKTAEIRARTGDIDHTEQAPDSAVEGSGEHVASRRSSARKRTPTAKVQDSATLEDDHEDCSVEGQHRRSGPPAVDGDAGKQGSESTAAAKSSASSSGGGASQGKKRRAGSQGTSKSSKRGGSKAKGKKQPKRRRLHLQPPKFDVEQHGGGTIRKRYSLDFKIKVAKYALSKDPNGQAKGGTIGPRYAAIQLGIPEAQSVREWMKRLPEMEAALADAQELGGASWSHHMANKKSFSLGKAPLTLGIEDQLIAYIKEIKAKGELPVSSRLLKEKAEELRPGVFGIPPDDDVVAIRKYEGKINSWCHRFLRRHRISGVNESPLKRRTFGSVASPTVSTSGPTVSTSGPTVSTSGGGGGNGSSGFAFSSGLPGLSGLVASAAGAVGISSIPGASPPQMLSLASASSTTAYTAPLAANTATATTTIDTTAFTTTATAAPASVAATAEITTVATTTPATTTAATTTAVGTIEPNSSDSVVHGRSATPGAAAVGGPRVVAATSYLGITPQAPPAQPGHASWPSPTMNLASFPSLANNSMSRDGASALTKGALQDPAAHQHSTAPGESGAVRNESSAVLDEGGAVSDEGGAEPTESDSPVRVDDDDDA